MEIKWTRGEAECAGLIDRGLANCHVDRAEAKWKSNPALWENVSWYGEKNTRNCVRVENAGGGWELWRAISRGKRTNQSINLLYARRHRLTRIYVNESNSYSRWLRLENGGRKNVNLTLNNIFRLLCPLCACLRERWSRGGLRNWVYCSIIFIVDIISKLGCHGSAKDMIYLFNKELKDLEIFAMITKIKKLKINDNSWWRVGDLWIYIL